MGQLNEKLIDKWKAEGLIDDEQAAIMCEDISQEKKDRASNKLIIVLSTIGSLFLGIGAFMFIASNWTMLSSFMKVLILLGCTAASYYSGFMLKYEKANLPRVGNALLFLGSLLFGASVFLVAQIYNVNANNHSLVLIWIIGVLPLIYAFKNGASAGLVATLFYLWIGLFVFRGFAMDAAANNFFGLPVLYLITGNLVYGIGSMHYFKDGFGKIARIYRLISLKVIVCALFFLTFKTFSGHHDSYWNVAKSFAEVTLQFSVSFYILAVVSILITVINLMFNPSKSKFHYLEDGISLGLVCVGLIFFAFPLVSSVYTVIFNLILVGLIFMLLVIGYQKEDMKVVNIGMSYLALFVIVRYFDFFWELLPRSVFFLVGGFILVAGGIAFEKKRSELKKELGQPKLVGAQNE